MRETELAVQNLDMDYKIQLASQKSMQLTAQAAGAWDGGHGAWITIGYSNVQKHSMSIIVACTADPVLHGAVLTANIYDGKI